MDDNFSPQIASALLLIPNLAIGGGWGGAKGVDDTIFPQRMEIDYVRVYQKKLPSPCYNNKKETHKYKHH